MNAKYRRVWWPIVTVRLGVSDRSDIGVSFRSRSLAAPINAVRRKRGGRVKTAQRRAVASGVLTRPSTSADWRVGAAGVERVRDRMTGHRVRARGAAGDG